MPNIRHKLKIEASVQKIFYAITTEEGLSGWWTTNTIAKPEVSSTARFSFENNYFKEMKITALTALKSVKWLCIEGYKSWIDTTISFQIQPIDDGCMLLFQHDGWKEYSDGFAVCSYNWAMFLRSLKSLCETGLGYPWPNKFQ